MPTIGILKADPENLLLTVDGRAVENSSITYDASGHGMPVLSIWPAAEEEAGFLPLSELLANFYYLTFHLDISTGESSRWSFDSATTRFRRKWSDGSSLVIEVSFDFESWDRPFSPTALRSAFKEFLAQGEEHKFKFWQLDEEDVEFGISVSLPRSAVVADIFGLSDAIYEMAEEVERNLSHENALDSILLRFEFPSAIRTACEQYLLYFVQFLRDLGIDSDTQVREEATGTLFTVTPSDEKTALDAIRRALALYLRLPDAPINFDWDLNQDVAVTQLGANVHHLKAQLLLNRAVLQAKDATIAALEAQADALKTKLDLVQYVDGKTIAVSPSSETESIIPGVLAVKKFDWKFLQVDVPELLRKLKRRF